MVMTMLSVDGDAQNCNAFAVREGKKRERKGCAGRGFVLDFAVVVGQDGESDKGTLEEKERKMAVLDTQKHVDTLREAGVSEGQARAQVGVWQDTLEGVATSADIKVLSAEIRGFRAEMKAEMKELRAEMKILRAETKAEMKELRAEMRSENKVLGGRIDVLGGRIDSLEGRIDNLRWTVGVGLTVTALWVPSMIFLAQILFR